MNAACYKVGDKVKHCASGDGFPTPFPAGCGQVTSVTPWADAKGYSYQVRCDKTGKILPANFQECDLESN